MQNKINASLESVSRARGQVGDLLYQLKSHISDTQAILQAVNRQREMFVQQYQG